VPAQGTPVQPVRWNFADLRRHCLITRALRRPPSACTDCTAKKRTNQNEDPALVRCHWWSDVAASGSIIPSLIVLNSENWGRHFVQQT
jgi:hypothetical protein